MLNGAPGAKKVQSANSRERAIAFPKSAASIARTIRIDANYLASMQTIGVNANENYSVVLQRMTQAAQRAGHAAQLLAVSKQQPAAAIDALVSAGQRSFGENYVQEAVRKQSELAALRGVPQPPGEKLEWHLIGPLQSNKARIAAMHFDWLQSLDRVALIEALSHHRPAHFLPLQVLIQVNIDDEGSKSGCAVPQIYEIAAALNAAPNLTLRGLMAIPAPHADVDLRIRAFDQMRILFEQLRDMWPSVDTLSMGMSGDFELAIAHGATMIRVGSALFGTRS